MDLNPYKPPQQEDELATATAESGWDTFTQKYYPAARTGLFLQLGLAVVTALILDMGQLHRAFWVAFICQWLMVVLIRIRRPLNPSDIDLALLRYGIVPIFLLITAVGPLLIEFFGLNR